MATYTPTLALADLEAFDPEARRSDRVERRFRCPLPPCADKRSSVRHRCFSVNTENGVFFCQRCGARGRLTDFWREHRRSNRSDRARVEVTRRAALNRIAAVDPEKPESFRIQLALGVPLAGSPGERYLVKRGIPLAVAARADVRYSCDFYGRPAVLFPVLDRAGKVVAVQGRYIDGRDDPKVRTAGQKRLGVFATVNAVNGALAICEAPIDALSLAACGMPAIAVLGTTWPHWLPVVMAFRRVFLATDADRAGDEAAAALTAQLSSLGARCERLRSQRKDWNEDFLALGKDTVLRVAADHGFTARGEAGNDLKPTDGPLVRYGVDQLALAIIGRVPPEAEENRPEREWV